MIRIILLITVIVFFALQAIAQNNEPISVEEEQLVTQAPGLKANVLKKALMAYRCAVKEGDIPNERYLSVIDYSLPSSKKRLWIFDLKTNRLLFNTYVAHGKGTGGVHATKFSNIPESHQSSIGLYKTGGTYGGKHGESLVLHGLEPGYNDNIRKRSIVLHGAWYVSDDFVKKHGLVGRSHGCPAVPDKLRKPIIKTIKKGTAMLAYYPDKKWLKDSHYLNCEESLKEEAPPKTDKTEATDKPEVTDKPEQSDPETSNI